MDALVELKMQSVLIYPNADAGGRRIISFLKKYEKYKFLKFTLNVNYNDYLGLFKYASAIIGNSSSGIIESPSFGIPSINIGTRQIGRAKAENVIDVGYNKDEIVTALKKALNNKDFIEKCRNCHSPYGNGTAGRKIVEILSRLNISKELTKKKNNFEK